MEDNLTDEEFEATYPFPVTHVSKEDGYWTNTAHKTIKEALLQPKFPWCYTPIVFGSWADYFEWKQLRTSNLTNHDQ